MICAGGLLPAFPGHLFAMTSSRPIRPQKKSGANAARRILIAAFDGVASLDVTGPLSVFAGANYVLGARGAVGYECDIVSMKGGLVATDLGAQFMSQRARNAVRRSLPQDQPKRLPRPFWSVGGALGLARASAPSTRPRRSFAMSVTAR